jgi:8-oxo-dGTP pyrophosphatase MutT (NUDIX family)
MAKPSRLSAGVVVVRATRDDGVRFLLLRAYRNWDFPKGLVHRGEAPLQAAVRETAEETGLDDLDFLWGEDYVETAPYAGKKVARYYLARTRTEQVVLGVNPELGRPEHHEYRWASLIQAVGLVPARLQPVLAWAARKVTNQMRR